MEKAEESQLFCAAPGAFVGSGSRGEELHKPSWPEEHQEVALSVEMVDQELGICAKVVSFILSHSSTPPISPSLNEWCQPVLSKLLLSHLSMVAAAVPLLRSRPAPGTLEKGLNHL